MKQITNYMARKDEIFRSFLKHEIFKQKYGLTKKELPEYVKDGLKSPIPIIITIAQIVECLESATPTTDKVLHDTITKLLNSSAL